MKHSVGALLALSVGCGGPAADDNGSGSGEPTELSSDGLSSDTQRPRGDGVELSLIKTPNGLAARAAGDAEGAIENCGSSCEEVCMGCGLSACSASGMTSCGAGARACLAACLSCAQPSGVTGACGVAVCQGANPECYFRHRGLSDFSRPVEAGNAPRSQSAPGASASPGSGETGPIER